MKIAALLSLLLAFFMNASMAESPKAVKVSEGDANAGLGYYNTTPESPDGSRIAYVKWPKTPKDDQAHPAELWICNRNLSGHRKLTDIAKAANHNGAYVLWVDDTRIAYRDGGSALVVDAKTGERLHGPFGLDVQMGHNAVSGRFAFSENAADSPLGARGVYAVDAVTGKVERIVATKDLAAAGSTDPSDWRIHHPVFTPDGTKLAINLVTAKGEQNMILTTFRADGSDIVFFGPKPMHFAWFDNETIFGHDHQIEDGQPNNWELRRWTRTAKFVETLAGVGCHFSNSPDNRWFVSDSVYGANPVHLKLYRRGETTPAATLMTTEFSHGVWERHAHVNPAFSRDGRRVYFNKAVDENKTQVFYCDIPGGGIATRGEIIHHESFDGGLDHWVLELEQPDASRVAIDGGKLDIDVKGGATIWFKPVLSGDLLIEYDATVVKAGGPNDRVSDFNQFWMASDPAKESLFTRNGKFTAYDDLLLYYVGMGGNKNTTTRFRKYLGDSTKPLLGEFTDAAHLLEANQRLHVEIWIVGGVTRFVVNGEQFFEYADPEPIKAGRFGFRTVDNHQWIHDFRVSKIAQ